MPASHPTWSVDPSTGGTHDHAAAAQPCSMPCGSVVWCQQSRVGWESWWSSPPPRWRTPARVPGVRRHLRRMRCCWAANVPCLAPRPKQSIIAVQTQCVAQGDRPARNMAEGHGEDANHSCSRNSSACSTSTASTSYAPTGSDQEAVCWICLDGVEAGTLEQVCGCASRPAHAKCIARSDTKRLGGPPGAPEAQGGRDRRIRCGWGCRGLGRARPPWCGHVSLLFHQRCKGAGRRQPRLSSLVGREMCMGRQGDVK